jgi:hypothetical protein
MLKIVINLAVNVVRFLWRIFDAGVSFNTMITVTNNEMPVFTASHSTSSDDENRETVLYSNLTSANSDVELGPPVSDVAEKVHERAVTMTTVLTHIMERPAVMRGWGLNE